MAFNGHADAYDYYMRAKEFELRKRQADPIIRANQLKNQMMEDSYTDQLKAIDLKNQITEQTILDNRLTNEYNARTLGDRVAGAGLKNRTDRAALEAQEMTNRFATDTYDKRLENFGTQSTLEQLSVVNQRFENEESERESKLKQMAQLQRIAKSVQEAYPDDPQRQQQAARNMARRRGVADGLVQQITPSAISEMAMAPIVGGTNGQAQFQFGGSSEVFKKPDGSYFQMVQRRNPKTGEVSSIEVPMTGKMVNDLGLDARQVIEHKGAETTITTSAQKETEQAYETVESIPKVIQMAQDSLNVVTQLKNHPGREFATGGSSRIAGMASSVGLAPEVADFEALRKQAAGGVFLDAIKLMGTAAGMTEEEGRQASAALARLETAQSEEGFLTALNDYEAIIKRNISSSNDKLQNAVDKIGKTRQGDYSLGSSSRGDGASSNRIDNTSGSGGSVAVGQIIYDSNGDAYRMNANGQPERVQ